ncbi:MAG: hypothetical protein CM15mP120_27960 [Pseudomonadota bacterium]|nr:MAG: hypothetical protein CM15mP120_27960 [Pseudomonadota bacterium]
MGQSAALIAGSALASNAPSAMAGLQKDDEITPEQIVTQYNNFMSLAKISRIPMRTPVP